MYRSIPDTGEILCGGLESKSVILFLVVRATEWLSFNYLPALLVIVLTGEQVPRLDAKSRVPHPALSRVFQLL